MADKESALQAKQPPIEEEKPLVMKHESPEEASASGFTFMVENLTQQLKLSGIIAGSVLCAYFLSSFGLSGMVLIILGASFVWQREMSLYKMKVRTEIQRRLGMKHVSLHALT